MHHSESSVDDKSTSYRAASTDFPDSRHSCLSIIASGWSTRQHLEQFSLVDHVKGSIREHRLWVLS